MTGGILQLVATNIEDTILTQNPQITLFKTVYRRYTSFSTYQHQLEFLQPPTFGSNSQLIFKNYGDLLHYVVLAIKLPEIQMYYPKMSKQDIQNLLRKYDIHYIFDNNNTTDVTNIELIEIRDLIIIRVIELQTNINNFNVIQNHLENFNPDINPIVINDNIDSYHQNIINNLMQYDSNNVFYFYIDALIKDLVAPQTIKNLSKLHYEFYNDILYFNQNNVFLLKIDPYLIHKSYYFIYHLQYAEYNLNIYNELQTIFNSTINNIFNDDITYLNLSAYKIYSNFITNNQTQISNIYDFKMIHSLLITKILNELTNNYIIFKNIFDSLRSKHKFFFIKQFKYQNSVNTHNINSNFFLFNQIVSQFNINDNVTSYYQNLNNITYWSQYVSTKYNDFLSNLIVIANNYNTNSYFNNDIGTLWKRFSVSANANISTTIPDYELLDNVYFFNFIYLHVITDLKKECLKYLEITYGINTSIYQSADSLLTTLNNNLLFHINTYVLFTNSDVTELINLAKYYNKHNQDLLFTGIISQEPIINGLMLFEYIQSQYQICLTQIIIDNNLTQTDTNILNSIHNSFFNLELISYNEYKQNGYRIYNWGYSDMIPISDAACVIWIKLQLGYKTNFNNLLNQYLLNLNYLNDNVGIEFYNYLLYIQNNLITPNYYNILTNINFYNLSSDHIYQDDELINPIINFIDSQIIINQLYLNNYNKYKNIVQVKNIKLNNKIFYYENTENILNKFITIIGNSELYGFQQNSQIDTDLNLIINSAINSNQHKISVGNVIETFCQDFNNNVNSLVNPFLNNSNLFNWYNSYIFELSLPEKSILLSILGDIQHTILNPESLYNDIINITANYNNFTTNIDIYHYIQNIFLKKSKLNLILNLKYIQSNNNEINIRQTWNLINSFFETQKQNQENILNQIDQTSDNSSIVLTDNKLYLQIKNKLHEQHAPFAWISEIGHFIINQITLMIGGQTIETFTGEWLHIYANLTKQISKHIGYNQMIGQTNLLTNYDVYKKPESLLYIPLPLWFAKRAESSLPMTALHLTDVILNISFQELFKLAKWDSNAKFKIPPKLNAFIIADYIYLSEPERILVATHKHEQLIEITQFQSPTIIGFEDLETSINGEYKFTQKLYFSDMIKEIIFGIQDVKHINNKNYAFYLDPNINYIKTISIRFNGRTREIAKHANYYNLCESYKYHTSVLDIGKYTYSFAIYPQAYQPSGAVNFEKINIVELEIIFQEQIIDYMRQGNLFKISNFAIGYNLLRIMSGMAGLGFTS